MSVRNCREIGPSLQKIMDRLLSNDRLVNLLYYTDNDPLGQPVLTSEQKKDLIFNKLIKIVPRVGPKETANSLVSMRVIRGVKNGKNGEFRDLIIGFEVFVPMTEWLIKDKNLRPFAILGELQESLDGKRVDGLGKMTGGDFQINFITEEISCYEATYYVTTYD